MNVKYHVKYLDNIIELCLLYKNLQVDTNIYYGVYKIEKDVSAKHTKKKKDSRFSA